MAIKKSVGVTPSERYLASLGEYAFLSLWSYPNVYRAPGKELCDLLVVCPPYVIVFSDKQIGWDSSVDVDVAWPRWYNRAIGHSAKQSKRAVNWIKQHPERLFLDAACTEKFPIQIPPPENLILHTVLVARGAKNACIRYFGGGSGSLNVAPELVTSTDQTFPFTVGNPGSNRQTVFHVVDEVSLPILLRELDTVADLSRYLMKREQLFKSNQLFAAAGEEDLLALYLKDIGPDGGHDFVEQTGVPLGKNTKLVVEDGTYNHFRTRGEYKRKKAADRSSYLWDGLIETFARNIISGDQFTIPNFGKPEQNQREMVVRQMALVSRLERRSHSDAIRGAFEAIGTRDRFFRAMLPGPTSQDTIGFFVLLLKRDSFLKDSSDEDYRTIRGNLLVAYAMGLLRRKRELTGVVGLATEAELSRKSRSEDALYAGQIEWDEDSVARAEADEDRLEIFKNDVFSEQRHIRPFEYPPSHHPSARGANPIPYAFHSTEGDTKNRATRRAEKAMKRRAKNF